MWLTVIERDELAESVVGLTLASPDGAELPPWEPGAHIDVVIDEGVVRQYSLCGSPAVCGELRIAVLREADGRGGSSRLCDTVEKGHRLQVGDIRNHFRLASSPRYLFIAGGIGITPLLPMIEQVEADGAQWELVYGGRTRRSMAFASELEDRYGDRVRICPEDETGLLDLAGLLGEPRTDTLVYCCGPEPLLKAVEERCAEWPASALRVERFAPRADFDSAGQEDAPFTVAVAGTDIAVTVDPGCRIVDALAAAGIEIPTNCGEGTCGSCETTVVDGEPDHRDAVLTDEERASGDTLMPCVSRSRSPVLVLDVDQ